MAPEATWVYLAYPIDLEEATPQDPWKIGVVAFRNVFLALEGTRGIFRPQQAFAIHGEASGTYVNSVNSVALGMADILVVFWPRYVETVGTTLEIDRACREGKRVIVVSDRPRTWSIQHWLENPNLLWVVPATRGGWPKAGEYAANATRVDWADQSTSQAEKIDAEIKLAHQANEADARVSLPNPWMQTPSQAARIAEAAVAAARSAAEIRFVQGHPSRFAPGGLLANPDPRYRND